jgi:hypothetical protein
MSYSEITPRPAGYPDAAPWRRADGSHSFAKTRAADLVDVSHARLALNSHGEPSRSIDSTVYTVPIVGVELLNGQRVRLTLETGRTITVQGGRWILCEFIAWADYRTDLN